jgi:putative ABC transport system permease protein
MMHLVEFLRGRTPLGWLQLTHNCGRFVLASMGVGVAVILVFMQLGFMNMLFDATINLHRQLNADVVILSAETKDMASAGLVSRRRLLQALGVEGVDWVEPLYITTTQWKRPSDGSEGQLLLIGTEPSAGIFTESEVESHIEKLRVPLTFLFDRGARGDFSAYIRRIENGSGTTTEINSINAIPAATFLFGSSFAVEATAITSTDTFMLLQPGRDPGLMNIGLIGVQAGFSPEEVASRIAPILGADAKVMSMDAFKALTRGFLERESPISYVFSFGALVGLFVGGIVVMQILSSDVQDHLSEYAMFKAIGFSNRYLLAIVYEQSAILTVFGYLPGLLISLGLYKLIGSVVAMQMTMTSERMMFVLIMTIFMCAASGTVALRRVYSADPADVF